MSRIVIPAIRTPLTVLERMHPEWYRWFRRTFLGVQERCLPTEIKTANYTASEWDAVMCDPTGGGFTVTLPEAPQNGTEVVIKEVGGSSNTVTIEGSGNDTVDGATTGLTSSREVVHVLYDSQQEEWRVIGRWP